MYLCSEDVPKWFMRRILEKYNKLKGCAVNRNMIKSLQCMLDKQIGQGGE